MIDDHILTTQGLIPGQPKGQLLLIACGALAREIVQILEIILMEELLVQEKIVWQCVRLNDVGKIQNHM